MRKIYLVRHGEAAATWQQDPDPGLSPMGIRQAESLAEHFGEVPVKHIFSSPLARAMQTAEPLGRAKDISIQVHQHFREIPSPVNIAMSERLEWLRSCVHKPWLSAAPEIISWRSSLLDSLEKLPDDAVVFTHFMVLNAVVAHIQSEPNLVCYQPGYCSILSLDLGRQMKVVDIGAESESRVL